MSEITTTELARLGREMIDQGNALLRAAGVDLQSRLDASRRSLAAMNCRPRPTAVSAVADLVVGHEPAPVVETFEADEAKQLADEVDRLALAVRIQNETCERLQRTIGERFITDAAPEHRALVQRIADAAAALVNAHAAESPFRTRLDAAGIDATRLPMPVPPLPRISVVPIEAWVKRARECGI